MAAAAPLGNDTVAALTTKSMVHPTLIHDWKKPLLSGASRTFGGAVGGSSRQRYADGRVPRQKGKNMKRILRNWLERHQHPVSLALHAIGIPATLIALAPLFWGEWVWFTGLFVGGYALQFIGHAIEGNDAGELILVKKALGLPYIAVVPRKPV